MQFIGKNVVNIFLITIWISAMFTSGGLWYFLLKLTRWNWIFWSELLLCVLSVWFDVVCCVALIELLAVCRKYVIKWKVCLSHRSNNFLLIKQLVGFFKICAWYWLMFSLLTFFIYSYLNTSILIKNYPKNMEEVVIGMLIWYQSFWWQVVSIVMPRDSCFQTVL